MLLLAAPASAAAAVEGHWRCDAQKPSQKLYLRIRNNLFDVARGPPYIWQHLCDGPSDFALTRKCARGKSNFVAEVTGVDGGDSYDFNPRKLRVVLRSWGMGFSLHRKLRCVEIDPRELEAAQRVTE
jgi:hypothetical protein